MSEGKLRSYTIRYGTDLGPTDTMHDMTKRVRSFKFQQDPTFRTATSNVLELDLGHDPMDLSLPNWTDDVFLRLIADPSGKKLTKACVFIPSAIAVIPGPEYQHVRLPGCSVILTPEDVLHDYPRIRELFPDA